MEGFQLVFLGEYDFENLDIIIHNTVGIFDRHESETKSSHDLSNGTSVLYSFHMNYAFEKYPE